MTPLWWEPGWQRRWKWSLQLLSKLGLTSLCKRALTFRILRTTRSSRFSSMALLHATDSGAVSTAMGSGFLERLPHC